MGSASVQASWSNSFAVGPTSMEPLPQMPALDVQSTVQAARKKRKRAPTVGAAADCFTCSGRGTMCDRKRPYCSQCLNEGKDCSGYKTQLTWGVGVASRGKLRGLSLPIAGTDKVAGSSDPSPKSRKKNPISESKKSNGTPVEQTEVQSASQPMNSPTSPIKTEPLQYSDHTFENAYGQEQPSTMAPNTSNAPEEVLQPRSMYSAPSQDPSFTLFHELMQHANFWPGSVPQNMSTSLQQGDYGSDNIFLDAQDLTRNMKILDETNEDEYAIADDLSPFPTNVTSRHMMIPSPFIGLATSVGKTPRMQYLINYYVEVISPVIVAFDNPNNPYRTQILRLAAESETLQHAISALSASNIRQRKETPLSTCKTDPARRSSFAHVALTDRSWVSAQDQVREETYHKSYAIQTLNTQLANPLVRKDDSILATLLILCLFHICDSGVAKFKTQFAGVKKLLNLRKDFALNSGTKWFTRMFTWFDAITATVNDRESQLQGTFVDISSMADEDGLSLETLAGCDSQLFRTIARLGRLNALRLGKIECGQPSNPFPPPIHDYSAIDGNGWGQMSQAGPGLKTNDPAYDDMQTQFWREWRDIRSLLQTWFPTTNPSLTADQNLDLANISECFRYSALLYTERLASVPGTSSADPSIQAWVRQSLEFIKQVKSDVYLLWPLFITGSECIEERDRDCVRERCLDIQKDSGFFNNQSCLGLLEKVWLGGEGKGVKGGGSAAGGGGGGGGGDGGSGFRFSEVMRMEGGDGEYIVV